MCRRVERWWPPVFPFFFGCDGGAAGCREAIVLDSCSSTPLPIDVADAGEDLCLPPIMHADDGWMYVGLESDCCSYLPVGPNLWSRTVVGVVVLWALFVLARINWAGTGQQLTCVAHIHRARMGFFVTYFRA
uniref:Uncharacterized protein n=1 Tax=Leersia perrieri TaxID=77586 RepID=A0A0D9X950_9ORYZ